MIIFVSTLDSRSTEFGNDANGDLSRRVMIINQILRVDSEMAGFTFP